MEVFVGSSKDSLTLKANPDLAVNAVSVVATRVWEVHENYCSFFRKCKN